MVQLAVDGKRHREVAAPGTIQEGDLVVAVGGDGTVLASLRAAAAQGAPVLGVACGSLGALTAVAADGIADALERVWAGDWTARSLPALAIGPADAPDDWAANDFVVVRRGAGQLVADVIVDDELYVRAGRRRAGGGHRAGLERVLDGGRRPGARGGHARPSSAPRWPCTAAARRRWWSRATPW